MVVTRTTRNRFVGVEPARGFESHALRQKEQQILIVISAVLYYVYADLLKRKQNFISNTARNNGLRVIYEML